MTGLGALMVVDIAVPDDDELGQALTGVKMDLAWPATLLWTLMPHLNSRENS